MRRARIQPTPRPHLLTLVLRSHSTRRNRSPRRRVRAHRACSSPRHGLGHRRRLRKGPPPPRRSPRHLRRRRPRRWRPPPTRAARRACSAQAASTLRPAQWIGPARWEAHAARTTARDRVAWTIALLTIALLAAGARCAGCGARSHLVRARTEGAARPEALRAATRLPAAAVRRGRFSALLDAPCPPTARVRRARLGRMRRLRR